MKPKNGRKKSGNGRGSQSGDNRAFQTTNGNYEGQSSMEGSPFTKEQLEHLHKFFQSPQFRMNSSIPNSSNNLSSSFAQSSTNFSIFSNVKPCKTNMWIIDSRASDHMTSSHFLFSTYTPCVGNKKIKVANGSFSAIARKGTTKISFSLVLHNVLHVPNQACNLISISKLSSPRIVVLYLTPLCVNFKTWSRGRLLTVLKNLVEFTFLMTTI